VARAEPGAASPDAALGRRSSRQTPGSASSRRSVATVIASGFPESVRLVDRPERRDFLHDLAPSAEGAHGQPAPDDLAERRQVWRHAVERLRASRVDAEAGHHLVEDEESAVRRGELAEACEEARQREDEPHVAGDWLHDHRRDVRFALEEPRERVEVVVRGRACPRSRPA
jgi:hypothetical protein